MKHEYRVYVYLAGDARYLLCTVLTAEGVGALMTALCQPENPGYSKIEVEIAPRALGG